MALRGCHPKGGELVQLRVDYLKKETKSKQKAVKIPECDDMETCAFLSILFKTTEELNLVLKSCISYIFMFIQGNTWSGGVKLNMFFQFNQIIKYWHVDLCRLWINPVGLLNAYKTHQSFGTWGIQRISESTWWFTEVELALPYFLALCSADIHILARHPGLHLQSMKEKRLLQSSLADVFYMCTLR